MLYSHTGPKQANDANSKKPGVGRNQKPAAVQPSREYSLPVGLALLMIALVAIAIIGLMVLQQLPPSIINTISTAMEKQALPAQAVSALTLLREQIENLVSSLRPFFIMLIVMSAVLAVLHRWAYWVALAVFLVYAVSFFRLGVQSAALQQNAGIPETASIGQSLGTAYTTAAAFNLFIIFILALLYRPYMRAWQALWP